MQAKRLIDKARLLGHADPKLHQLLGLKGRSYLGDVYAGSIKLSPEVAALLADLVGEDAQEAAARQLVENAAEPRRSMLERALFTLGAHGVAFALLGTPTVTDAKQSVGAPTTELTCQVVDTLYIVLRAVVTCLRSLARGGRRTDHQGLRPRYPRGLRPPFGLPPLTAAFQGNSL